MFKNLQKVTIIHISFQKSYQRFVYRMLVLSIVDGSYIAGLI